jgi:hypothetical protein
VYVPRVSPKKFREIEESGSTSENTPTPNRPTRHKQRVEVYVKVCDWCQRGKRDCEVDILGKASINVTTWGR